VAGTLIAGYGAGQLLGFSFYDSLFVALAISVTSTVIVMRLLEELKMISDGILVHAIYQGYLKTHCSYVTSI
jgi:Kef-type K+ transport system membrane component KefB